MKRIVLLVLLPIGLYGLYDLGFLIYYAISYEFMFPSLFIRPVLMTYGAWYVYKKLGDHHRKKKSE